MLSQETVVFKTVVQRGILIPKYPKVKGTSLSFSRSHPLPWYLYPPSSLLVLSPTGGVPHRQGPLPHPATWVWPFLFGPVCSSESLAVWPGLFSPQRWEQTEGEKEPELDAPRGFGRKALCVCLSCPPTASVLFAAEHLMCSPRGGKSDGPGA